MNELQRRMTATLAIVLCGVCIADPLTAQQSGTPLQPSTVIIGTQRWTASNLQATRFNNGDAIPQITDGAAWAAAGRAGEPAWSFYANANEPPANWGVLYNYAAITDPRGLCPSGFRIPSNDDWLLLETSLGSAEAAAAALKSKTGWPESGAGTNSSGFSALPAGFRTQRGEYFLGQRVTYFWSSSRQADESTTAHMLFDDQRPLFRIQYSLAMGMSVRCLQT